MFNKVVVANRGAVASRVLRALAEMGIRTVAVYSEADAGAPYLALAGESLRNRAGARSRELPRPGRGCSKSCGRSGADGLHPGYGFLSENAGVRAARERKPARASSARRPRWIEAMGHKTRARELAARYGMPMTKGSDVLPARAGCDPRGRARHRLPGAGQARGRRRRDRHAAGERRDRAARRGRALALDGGPRLRHCRGLSGAPDGAAAPRRVPGAGRRARRGGASLRARLLDAAAQPEGDRGGAGAGPRARAGDGHGGAGGGHHARHGLRQHRHRGDADRARTARSASSR